MNMAYPATLKTYSNGQIGVFFVDVPEAITAGNNLTVALDLAQDALVVALSGYLDDALPIPTPSKAKRAGKVRKGSGLAFCSSSLSDLLS